MEIFFKTLGSVFYYMKIKLDLLLYTAKYNYQSIYTYEKLKVSKNPLAWTDL